MTQYLAVAVAVLATALLLVMEHWLVYAVRQAPLPAPVNYAAGSAAVWVGFALWAFLNGDMAPAGVLGVVYVLAGGLLILMHLAESTREGMGHRARADYLEARHTGEDDGAPA